MYTEEDLENAKYIYKNNIPYTKESLHYRKRFCETFDDNVSNVIPYFWLPKWGNVKDPSARVLDVYNST
jgi:asparagine synthase (glutamine-hydrolysing)